MTSLVSHKEPKLENLVITPNDESCKFNYYTLVGSGFEEGWYCANEIGGIVSTYINEKLRQYNQDVKWIKGVSNTSEYSFAPLIFQCKNTIFAVNYIEYVNNDRIEDEEECDFIPVAIENNFIPCFIEVFSEITPSSSKTYVKSTERLKLLDARTMEEIDPIAIASDEPTLMSEHEQFHIAVKVISYALKQRGFNVEYMSIITRFDRYPNIRFYDEKGNLCLVDVRYTNDLNDLKKADFYKYSHTVRPSRVYEQYLAPVFIGSPNEQIYRNQPLNISFLKDIIIKLPLTE